MKNLKPFLLLLLLINITSCTNEDVEIDAEPTLTLTNYIYKTYNISNNPNTVINSRDYSIENNKIISYSHINQETAQVSNGVYTYTNDRLSEVSIFEEGNLIRKNIYLYDNNGNLIEYLRELNSTQGLIFNKAIFSHTNDTIFLETRQSIDGINFDINISDSKVVLDNSDNRTYFESFSYFNNDISIITNSYDANNNMLTHERFAQIDGINFFSVLTNTYTYDSNKNNPLAFINEATFGSRVNLMLLFVFMDSAAINDYSAKHLSYNSFETFTSTFFGNANISSEFINTLDSNNQTVFSDFRTVADGVLLSRFTNEYIYNLL